MEADCSPPSQEPLLPAEENMLGTGEPHMKGEAHGGEGLQEKLPLFLLVPMESLVGSSPSSSGHPDNNTIAILQMIRLRSSPEIMAKGRSELETFGPDAPPTPACQIPSLLL